MAGSVVRIPKQPEPEFPDTPPHHLEPWWTDWERLSALLAAGRGSEARAYAQELGERWPNVKAIQQYARALEPSIARRVPGAPQFRSLDQDYAWLRDHAHEYPGCWLAVFEGRLLAADTDLNRVTEIARRELGNTDAVLFYQPSRSG